MIVVDTSALMAMVQREPEAGSCTDAIASASEIGISAGTLAEALVVATRRGIGNRMSEFVDSLRMEVRPVTADTARQVGEAYARWGKGLHRAGLNWGDCFAYVLAQDLRSPLLYVGDDFARNDVESARPPSLPPA